jgi:F-type H+-transporting ATPase subunit b
MLALACVIPMSALAAETAAEGWGWVETLGRWFNLFILFGAIVYFTREPIARFFRSRRDEITREIDAARQAREEAEQKLAEAETRLKNLDAEIESIRKQAKADAEAEKNRILGLAEEEAEKILAAAGREIEGLSKVARQELRSYAADLAVKLAEEQVRHELDSGSHERIIESFFEKLRTDSERRPS